jgi:hypothetical protein
MTSGHTIIFSDHQSPSGESNTTQKQRVLHSQICRYAFAIAIANASYV